MSAQVQAARHADVACLKLSGELRHTLAEDIQEFSDRLFEQDQIPQHLVIDLSEAVFMDSTVIGLVVSLARELSERDLPPATVACSEPEITQMFHNLRLDDVFVMVEDGSAPAVAAFSPVLDDGAKEDALQHARMVLRAHEALIAANEENRKSFAAVVELFRMEVERLEAEQGER
ncbi:STAS domain-containing protein [Pseudomarimonas arenosa]|uniref:STAS domain-containing protein n=1 Tax=Pseudomarimonas arenosa TaxID=2774145 RepID=A0AAW3ZH66_9GAMM|nr:STAS domain-containing protein [Pseudomarimonas arenosa]MBD8524342.1 STAS domain-containing protein [Pseudomarimonas arenosa]